MPCSHSLHLSLTAYIQYIVLAKINAVLICGIFTPSSKQPCNFRLTQMLLLMFYTVVGVNTHLAQGLGLSNPSCVRGCFVSCLILLIRHLYNLPHRYIYTVPSVYPLNSTSLFIFWCTMSHGETVATPLCLSWHHYIGTTSTCQIT